MKSITTAERFSKNRNQAISLLLIALSLIVGFFATKDQYEKYIQNTDTLSLVTQDVTVKKTTLDSLNAMKTQVENDADMQADIGRYAAEYREDNFIESIFMKFTGIDVSSMTLDAGDTLPSGLSYGKVSLALQSQNIAVLNSYLDYLTSEKSDRRYVIENVDFPFSVSSATPFPVSLQIGTYYLSK